MRFVEESGNGTAKLTREQRGQFVATAWLAQMHKHFSEPKPSISRLGPISPPGSRRRTRTSSARSSMRRGRSQVEGFAK